MIDLRKSLTSFITVIVLLLVFLFAAVMEYRYEIEVEKDSLREELVNVAINIEGMISSRIINANGVAATIQIEQASGQNLFDLFAEGIFESEDQVVKDVVFITDTTITDVYPAYLGLDAIGVDLAKIPEQRDLLLFSKENMQTVFFGPVDLVEGGKGIIVRVPVAIEGEYYGQVAIVFDYWNFTVVSGLEDLADRNHIHLSGNDPLTNESTVIWGSGDEKDERFISETIDLYDIEWTISAMPHYSWRGTSTLFYLILIVGFITVLGATYSILRERRLKRQLQAANKDLKKTVVELAHSKEDLLRQNEEIREKERFIQQLADHDGLTGLYNRRLFTEHLTKALGEGVHGLVVLIDIDDFKNVNDIHGHVYGDELLKEFSATLHEILGNSNRLYRFGGDEFLVLFENEYDNKRIMEYASSVQQKVSEKIRRKIHSPITMSTGVVRFPEQGSDVESLLIRADVAMYKSKDSGKNQVTIFEESLLRSLDKKLRIEDHIRKALSEKAFSMYYQPIVEAGSGKVVSFEALIRLNDRAYSPMEFIQVAESTGFIIRLGEWILEEVIDKVSLWLSKGLPVKPVAINISPRQLVEPEFRQMFMEIIRKSEVPLHLIELEITENVFLENQMENIAILQDLRSAGIKVSMDDFGTGYSSLKYLTYLPIDKVKLDKSLKDQLLGMNNKNVLSGIITMVHGLGMKVVTEGIEEKREWEQLKALGCDFVQGYHFSKPVPCEDIPELLEKTYM